MDGSAKELGEALVINPNNTEDIVEAINTALALSVDEQKRANKIMRQRLKRYNIVRWAENFLEDMGRVKKDQEHLDEHLITEKVLEKISQEYKNSSSRLLFLDYDGTLTSIVAQPHLARPNPEIIDLLEIFSGQKGTEICVISGRDRHTLQEWLGGLDIHLVAVHGVWIKKRGEDWKLFQVVNTPWKEKLIPILETYTDRVPGSFIEEKDFSIAWHYRRADPELANVLAKELLEHITSFTATIEVQVLQGKKVIEIRSAGINKGAAAVSFLDQSKKEFLFAAGDDTTDEDIFKALPQSAYTVKVGLGKTNARFNTRSPFHLVGILHRLARIKL